MTLKLEVGKSYKTRGGWKAEVSGLCGGFQFSVSHYRAGKRETIFHHQNGESNLWPSYKEYDLIAEWEEEEMIEELPDLTKIEKPFGLLDKKTQERLKAHGGPYQMYFSDGWKTLDVPFWSASSTYRVKPAPVVEYKKTDWVTSKHTGFGYEITEKFIDGKYDSYTVDMVPF